MNINKYRNSWIAIYILLNLFAAVVFYNTRELDGDLIGYPLPNNEILFLTTSAVVFSYIVWMGLVFKLFSSISISPVFRDWSRYVQLSDEKKVGYLIFVIQTLFFLYCIKEGVNVAGSLAVSESPIRFLWVLFVPDTLFLVYYGIYRKSRFFPPNLVLYLVSNVVRGWLGMWIIVLFIEGAYRVYEGRIKWSRFLPLGCLGFLSLPFLYQLKLSIRTAKDASFSMTAIVSDTLTSLQDLGWAGAFENAIWPVLMRFQHLANVIGIAEKSDVLSSAVQNGEFMYFFEEGVPQYTLRKLFDIQNISDIHLQLLTYLIPEQLPVDAVTNTHVGLVGWLWVTPYLAPLYFVYILFLSWCAIWLGRKAGGAPLLMNVIWFAWLGFLMNGWFAAYIDFLQAIVIMIFIRIVFRTRGVWHKDSLNGVANA